MELDTVYRHSENLDENNQLIINGLVVMSLQPVRPFPDSPAMIRRILSFIGKDVQNIIADTGLGKSIISNFINNTGHSPKVAYWFEQHGIYLDRDYVDPMKSGKVTIFTKEQLKGKTKNEF